MIYLEISNIQDLEKNKRTILNWESLNTLLKIKFYFKTKKGIYIYYLKNTYLKGDYINNSAILDYINTEITHIEFISSIIRYEAEEGLFPEFRYRDGEALYKIIKKIYELSDKKFSNSNICIKGSDEPSLITI